MSSKSVKATLRALSQTKHKKRKKPELNSAWHTESINVSLLGKLGAGEIAYSIKCLMLKHEDMSSCLHHHTCIGKWDSKKEGTQNPSTEGLEE